MTPERWQQIKYLFQEARELDATARHAFLTAACAGDEEKRRQVEAMLAADSQIDTLLDQPAAAAAPELFSTAAKQFQSQAPSQAEAAADASAKPCLNGYQLLREIGRGGMGEVHLAYDTRLARQVAVKLLPARFTADAERVRRFEREARTVSALNHPHIVTIHDFGVQDGRHYLVTEFIEGQTLRAAWQRQPFTPLQALELTIQIASALAAAHQAGLIHRDIKPENVMLRPDGYVKVLDFGLAKLTEHTSAEDADTLGSEYSSFQTQPGVVLGTVSYMSPEQARGQKLDARTDIFSLGVLLYEMLAGRRPFDGATRSHTLVAIADAAPPPLPAAMPVGLQLLVNRMLAKERTGRYATAQELLGALRQIKDELIAAEVRSSGKLPVQAVATSAVAGASTTAHAGEGNRLGRAALAVLLLALVVGLGWVVYRATRPPAAAIDSLAVLPFVNQTRTPETEYLADGLTESIINNLAQLSEVTVIARASVFRFKNKTDDPLGAANKLGARAVVVGSVLQQGDTLTISAELVDVAQNKQLWGQRYRDRRIADYFAIQEEIARQISTQLRVKLTDTERRQLARRPTENLKAFEYYTQGRTAIQQRTRENTQQAISYYEKALAEDANFALAYTGLADAYTILGARAYIPPSEARRKTEEAARKALALDENLAEAYTALGQTWWYAPYNFALTDRAFRRALELNPNLANTYAYLCYSLAGQGRFEESIRAITRARELDPLSPAIARTEALPYLLKRDYAKALELLHQAAELGPPFTQTWEIGAYLPTKLYDQALRELEQAKRTRPQDPLLIGSTGIVYAAQGKRAEALQVIRELEALSGASLSQANWVTKIYAVLNEQEKALSLLERSLAADEIGVFYQNEPIWDALRTTPRFAALVQRMGIPP